MLNSVLSHINWLHVLVAALAYFALGFFWYSIAFGKAWIKYSNINMEDPNARKGAGAIMFISFLLMAVTTVGLAILLQVLPAINAIGGLKLGLLLGLTISSTSIGIGYLYNKKPLPLYFIDCGYHVVGLCIAGLILAGWK